ncbi:MAG: hypothetical protein LBS55_13425 [Prevotellaceae bacterium]|jgi:hypothetical protein|nr:hypothetical protein [Prevotellaceae bacterium]
MIDKGLLLVIDTSYGKIAKKDIKCLAFFIKNNGEKFRDIILSQNIQFKNK